MMACNSFFILLFSLFSTGMPQNIELYHSKRKKRIGQYSNKGGAESKTTYFTTVTVPSTWSCQTPDHLLWILTNPNSNSH